MHLRYSPNSYFLQKYNCCRVMIFSHFLCLCIMRKFSRKNNCDDFAKKNNFVHAKILGGKSGSFAKKIQKRNYLLWNNKTFNAEISEQRIPQVFCAKSIFDKFRIFFAFFALFSVSRKKRNFEKKFSFAVNPSKHHFLNS